MFFSSWSALGRVAVLSALGYLSLLLMVRASGKRTLSSLNVSDLVVTVALGNVLAMTALSKDVTLAQGTAAVAVLIGLEFLGDWTAYRWGAVRRLLRSTPVLLLYEGRFDRRAMHRERVHEEDILDAVRRQGIASLDDVVAAVLEPPGTISVLRKTPAGGTDALRNVVSPGLGPGERPAESRRRAGAP